MRTLYLIFLVLTLAVLSAFIFNDDNKGGNESLVITSQKLDANRISTWFRTNGSFNYNPVNSALPGFEWPKGSNLFARFASGLWLGARVGNDTLVAIASYSFEYLNGYTDINGVPQGENDPAYRIYRLTFGVNDQDRAQWPNSLLGNSNQGAPVFFDNLTNSWKPLDFGHQTLFYRYTDSYPQSHTVQNGSTAPLKADVMKLDFSLNVAGGLADVAFSQFTIINKSSNTWNDAYFTIWTDDDLGGPNDDKVACDSILQMGYTYNATNNDPEYGSSPPAVGFLMLRGALRFTGLNSDTVYICRSKTRIPLTGFRDLRMSVFNWYANTSDPVSGNPTSFRGSYRYMSGYRRDGSNIIHPNGYVTKLIYSGDPVANFGWIQPTAGDQRFMMSTGPVNVAPGDTQVVVVAQLIARGTSNLNSISTLRILANEVKNYYYSCYTSPAIGIEPISNQIPNEFKLHQNYPNPFNPVTKIRFDIPNAETHGNASLHVYDALGRLVKTLINQPLRAGEYEVNFDGTNLPSGVYFYQLLTNEFTQTKKMLMIK